VTTDPVISVEGLVKHYRAGVWRTVVRAVRGLSLTVPRGSIVAFLGPNGAGKTTTIHTLLGFLQPTEGRVLVFGEAPSPSVMQRVGYQPEIFHPYPFYSAREALRYYGRLSGMSTADLERAVLPLLDRVGLTEAGARPVSSFSKGMTQRLGLAQALLHDPELLILDEPTSGLDPEGRRLVLDLIRDEKSRGRTVFLSSHILSDVERTCDEVVMVREGEVVLTDRLSSFGASSRHWDIEVLGWRPEHRSLLGVGATVVRETVVAEGGGSAVVRCDAAQKQALLRVLVGASVDIGTVQPTRGASLEDAYLKHAGRAS
jgi:ABC-2 type transport system ATP-binding protein